MSFTITRNTLTSYDERMKRADRLGVLAVAACTLVILAIAFLSANWQTVSHLVRSATHSVAAGGSHISNVPLEVAFAAMVGVISVAIGLAIRERQADEDKDVFDIR